MEMSRDKIEPGMISCSFCGEIIRTGAVAWDHHRRVCDELPESAKIQKEKTTRETHPEDGEHAPQPADDGSTQRRTQTTDDGAASGPGKVLSGSLPCVGMADAPVHPLDWKKTIGQCHANGTAAQADEKEVLKTFYIAGPYNTKDEIQRLADLLSFTCDMRWHNDFNWTIQPPWKDGGPAPRTVSEIEILSSMWADLFVCRLQPDETPRMTFIELGARIASGGIAHVILNGIDPESIIGLAHPAVRLHVDDQWFWTRWDRQEAMHGRRLYI